MTLKASYIPRPAVNARIPNDTIDKDGVAIISPKPHPELIASLATVIPLQEQVDSLNRIGRIKRSSALANIELDDDDYGDYIDPDDVQGLTPYELDGMTPFNPNKVRHDVPPDEPEPMKASAPQNAGEPS